MGLGVLLSVLLCWIGQVLVLPPGIHMPTQWTGHLMWIALVPFFVSIEKQKTFRRVWMWAYLFFVLYFASHLYWFTVAIHVYGKVPFILSCGALLAYAALLSFYGAFAVSISLFISRKLPHVPGFLIVALGLVSLEFLRARTLTGFPWGNFSDSQTFANLPIVQISEIFGQNGVLFLLVATNYFVADSFLKWRSGRLQMNLRPAMIFLVVLLVAHVGGWMRWKQVASSYGELLKGPVLKVQALQGNIPQDEKWDQGLARRNLERFLALRSQRNPAVHLSVWPEAAFPYSIDTQTKSVAFLAAEDLFQIVGIATEDAAQAQMFNSAYLVHPDGTLMDRYDKTHLVPFGEYVPYKFIFGIFGKLVPGIADFTHGESFEPFEVRPKFWMGETPKAGVLICYEDIFSEIAHKQRLLGATFFVNLTNDAWYGRTSAAWQHLAMSVYRAIENRRVLLRATNTGVSALISPSGDRLQTLPWFTTSTLEADIPLGVIQKFTDRWPHEWFSWFSMTIFSMLFFCAWQRRR